MSSFLVVGCSDCEGVWVVQPDVDQETVECRSCGTRFALADRNQLGAADDHATAAEIRSRVLAQRAGALDHYQTEDGYADQERRVRDRLWNPADNQGWREVGVRYGFEERLEQRVEERTPWWQDVLAEEADARLERLYTRDVWDARDDADVPADGSIDITDQAPVDTDVTVREESVTQTALHAAVVDDEQMTDALLAAVRDLVAGQAPAGARETLRDAGVTALDGLFADLCLGAVDDLVNPDIGTDAESDDDLPNLGRESRDDLSKLVETLPTLGTGQDPFGIRNDEADLLRGPVALFAASEVTPRVAITVPSSFTDARADQRRDWLDLVAAFAQGCDVTLVTGRIEATFLFDRHFDHPAVPNRLAESVDARLTQMPSGQEFEAEVEAAREDLSARSRPVKILRRLEQEPTQTLEYGALAQKQACESSTIQACVSKTLNEKGHQIFRRVQTGGRTGVTITKLGEALLDRLDAETADLSQFGDSSSGGLATSSNSSDDSRVTTRDGMGEGTARRPAAEAEAATAEGERGLVTTRWLDGTEMAVSRAPGGAEVSLVPCDHPGFEDVRQPARGYDDDRDRLVVGAQYQNPMQYWVCVALALADGLTAVPSVEPSDVQSVSGDLEDYFDSNRGLLRGMRCLGYLPDDVATPWGYVEELQDAAQDLRELSNDTNCWEEKHYESASDARSLILREAHGLAGTLAHFYELLGVDITRLCWIDNHRKNFTIDEDEGKTPYMDLFKTLGIGAAIQSQYGHFNVYRQLYERREEKRGGTTPQVDADDPWGELIGNVAIIGKNVDDFADVDDLSGVDVSLQSAMASPKEVHEEAPEVGVPVDVEVADRRHHAARVARYVCQSKGLRLSRVPMNLIYGLAGDVRTVARALQRGLSGGENGRDLAIDEVRTALHRGVEPTDLLPGHKPSVKKLVHALLGARDPIPTIRELVDRAGISRQSFLNNEETLRALDLVEETSEGWRATLSFTTERGQQIAPDYVLEDSVRLRDAMYDAVEDLVAPEDYYEVSKHLGVTDGPPDYDAVVEALPDLEPWIETIDRLASVADLEPQVSATSVLGVRPKQASLQSCETLKTDAVGRFLEAAD